MWRYPLIIQALVFPSIVSAAGLFDLSISISNPGGTFSASQLVELQASVDHAESVWEGIIIGYQPGINRSGISINVVPGPDFALTNYPQTTVEQGYTLSVFTTIFVNPMVIDDYASWTGVGPPNPNPDFLGLNYLDDIMLHEVGHALGIGLLWEENGVYLPTTGEYTGQYGLMAYRQEFDPLADFVPVEQALSAAADLHWDQVIRSSPDEGNPGDPYSLSPLTGITDSHGHDLGMEVMTGVIDADYGKPFLSNTTIQSLRDLGFVVIPEPATLGMAGVTTIILVFRRRNIRRT